MLDFRVGFRKSASSYAFDGIRTMARPTTFRHRSSSGGSPSEMIGASSNYSESTVPLPTLKAASHMMYMTLHLKDVSGKSFLHTIDSSNISLAKALLDRAQQVDFLWEKTPKVNNLEDKQQQYYDKTKWLHDFLLNPDEENGYTPLHWAVWNKNIAAILLLLRHALNAGNIHSTSRLTHRPAMVIEGDATANELAQKMAQAVDNEGLTPLQLLQHLQHHELERCRMSLPKPSFVTTARPISERSQRRPSFDSTLDDDDEQDEFGSLRRDMRLLASLSTDRNHRNTGHKASSSDTYDLPPYACEVLTFGPAHHCALGVPQGGGGGQNKSSSTTHFRPQRVQAFGLDAIGREGSATAIAASTHHTLVVTRDGHLFTFGLGTGGRLGTGDERHRPLPTRVLGALMKRNVTAIAAAENHSLCVTSDGNVFAWGSDRFGQLGVTTNDESQTTTRCLPRRVDELKQIHCVAVAAGEKHSVALSRRGEVYVWGDNSAGQLGVSRRNGFQRVHRVDALWNATPSKQAIAIAASGMSTVVLTSPTGKTGQNVNSVYSWGHGNHMPIKVQFGIARGGNQRSYHVNPVSIACAKYHNVVVTADGRVYTWGLHREPLGSDTSKKSYTQSMVIASPQLVTGMLPENGGGLAVAVAASENHTAVLTDCGSLFTWGASHGNNVLGHEGVRWQPIPKRVPGVHRAVAVASAKEHTVLLIGASFPDVPIPSSSSSLEYRCAAVVAQHVDLFNVIPVLIMSERSQNSFLIEYCQEFVRRNLDGVLNLGRKSEMNSYLDEQLADGLHILLHQERDGHHHPFIFDVVTAGNSNRPSFRAEVTCCSPDWARACQILEKRLPTSCQVKLRVISSVHRRLRRSRGSSFAEEHRAKSTTTTGDVSKVLETGFQGCSDRCLMLTATMDLSSSDAVKAKYDSLTKEVRGIRKRLNQIVKLIDTEPSSEPMELSVEQQEKVSRRPLLQADLAVLERALERVTQRMREYNLLCQPMESAEKELKCDENATDENEHDPNRRPSPHRCSTCDIECPDENSYMFHLNGRKHRNRVLQVAEDEKRQTAAIMEENQNGVVRWDDPVASEVRRNDSGTAITIAPFYKLPPPPHPVLDIVETPNSVAAPKAAKWASPSVSPKTPKGFRDILKEESEKASNSARKGDQMKVLASTVPMLSSGDCRSPKSIKSAGAVPSTPMKSSALKLPAGSAAPLKSPPWAAATVSQFPVKATKVLKVPGGSVPPSKSPPDDSGGGSQTPLKQSAVMKLPIGSAPPPKCPPWAASGVHVSQVFPTTPTLHGRPTQLDEDSVKRVGISLGDFMTKSPGVLALETPPATFSAAQAKIVAPPTWSTPKTIVKTLETPKQQSKGLLEIQQEEEAYNQVQGKDSIINKWYVGRREKTGSLVEIQEEDSKEREFRLLVEEQRRIEEQIQREREEQEKIRGHSKRRNQKSPKPQNKAKGNRESQNTPQQL